MERPMLETGVVKARRLPRARGFTLVELSMVITIVAILAMIAVVGYRRYILNAKVTEAKNGVLAIEVAQNDHMMESGSYVDLGTTYCPVGAGVADMKVGWDPTCGSGTLKWQELTVHMSGAVQFAYATAANNTTAFSGSPLGTSWVTWNNPTKVPWFVVSAKCDLDGIAGNDTEVVGSSFQNTLFVRNEGQ